MTRLYIGGGESGALASEASGVVGSATVSTLESRSGSFSIYMPGGASGSRFQLRTRGTNGAVAFWSAANCYVDFYIMVKGSPSALVQLVSIATTAPASQVAIDMTTSRTLQLWYTNGAGAKTSIGSASGVLARNRWYRVTLIGTALSTGGSSTATLKLDGTTVATASSLTVLATPAVSAQTFWGSASAITTDYYLDDIRIDDASEPVVSGVYFGRVLDNGSTAQWTAGGGAATAYEAVRDDYAAETTKIISSSSAGQVHLFALRKFSAWFPAGTVHTVMSHVQMAETSGSTSGVSLRMRENSTNADTADYTALTSSYEWLGQIRQTAPDGSAWTMAKLDALEVGVVLNSATATTVAAATVYCYAEMTPDDGTWVYIDWVNRFHEGNEWPGKFDAFHYTASGTDAAPNATADVVSFTTRRGRTRVTDEFSPGTASISLNNGTGRYNLRAQNVGDEVMRLNSVGSPVRICGASNGYLYGIFFGYVARIRQVHRSDGPVLEVEATEGLEWLRRKSVEFAATASATISSTLGYSAANSLGNRLGIAGTNIEKNWRIDTTSRTLTRFWFQGDGLAAARKLAYESGAYSASSDDDWFFMDQNGYYRYRTTGWQDGWIDSPGETIRTGSAVIEIEDPGGYSGGKVTFAKFTTSGSTTVLYTHAGDPLPIPTGTSRIRLDYSSPAAAHASLTATTDFTANTAADGSGTNITGSVTITTSGGLFWQTGGEFIVTNSSGSAGYLTFLQWRGNVITHDQSQVRTSGSEPFKVQAYEFMDSATDAANRAAMIDDAVGTYPLKYVRVVSPVSGANEREVALKLDIGMMVALDTTSGLFPSDLSDPRIVQGIQWQQSPQGGTVVTYDLAGEGV